MAKRPNRMEQQPAQAAPPPKKNLTWIVWAGLSVLSVILLIAVLHMSGAISAPEEALYQATKNTPVVKYFTGWMHQQDWEEELSPGEIINVKDLRNNLERAERKISEMETQLKQANQSLQQFNEVNKKVVSLEKGVSELLELGYMTPQTVSAIQSQPAQGAPQGAAQAQPAAQPAAGQPAAAPAQPAVPQTPQAQAARAAVAQGNYRKIGQIFEELDSDTSVDILNQMTQSERVAILSSMEQGTVAEILSAFDPADSAELARALAQSR